MPEPASAPGSASGSASEGDDSAEPADPADSADAAVPTGPAEPADAAGSAEPVESADSTDAADPAAPAEPSVEPTVRDAVSAPGPDGEPRRVTRRFPLFTRDTARPEGGGRAAPRGAPAPARQWPILTVTGLVGLGLLLTALDAFKVGTLLIGLALLAGGVMRWMLPDVGMLAVRSRFTDLVTYGVLGVTIALLAMMAQPHPWLVLPFLDDTLHFTIRT
ncbi:DUF3017 domain-containing protein [Streptomyces sp. CWNU-52B]|uniref:DUF3017 domain-containing protein n=1 Tax=unclassified Streptomyces TaxID=2593676 RepID=UPI0039C0BE41